MPYDILADLPSPKKTTIALGDRGCRLRKPDCDESSGCATETTPGPSAKTVSSALVSVAG
ncbi:hypothetical protein DPMN_160613 [Dreissena polymorpha]|uniref:Uncharacterized protein n=1 Tax=Dreissena polymorpha TaxID=45954 RepID=A0A9D4EL43_DREPO|nr:hypothetical protein DPMN_160613 [Dreissena polymorpha]